MARKVITTKEANKIRAKHGLPPLEPRITAATVKAALKRKARELPKETRQEILNLLWAGKTPEQVAELTSVTLDQVTGVLLLNTYTVQVTRKESL